MQVLKPPFNQIGTGEIVIYCSMWVHMCETYNVYVYERNMVCGCDEERRAGQKINKAAIVIARIILYALSVICVVCVLGKRTNDASD